jgi:hypothetical protein
MRDPDSPSNKPPFKVSVNFDSIGSKVATTPLMKLLAKRSNMTGKEFMNAQDPGKRSLNNSYYFRPSAKVTNDIVLEA